ncbi:septal ring lytic transglycosylase RlpA family protein [Jiella endophytica]|uniref:Endolytic peptidoglycan transglycosylase RlpA n=1 Tax=Jiella endophytica TaxID=2558362 RepID=A0A4Y8RUM1_9HYPH|nr:septal ring lytic transglycosylase RlpA family protein [Jiella endophytica]TFF27507.1 septal ring lytic transglycosylase RlpA family protein [Jiella endophytica]
MLERGGVGRRAAGLCVVGLTTLLVGCQGSGSDAESPLEQLAELSTSVKFDSRTFGVPASPRVTNLKRVRKGGGRDQVGKPYKVRGKWYYPKEQPGYVKSGKASWYGPNFHGRLTANGEVYDMHGLSAAHKTFPLPSYAMVTNLDNGSKLMVRVNDRGPYAHGREIDLSAEAAELLGFRSAGTADVKVEYVGRAPLEGDDTKMLMASFEPGDGGQTMPGHVPDSVMVASAISQRPLSDGAAMANAYGDDLPGVAAPGAPVPMMRPASSGGNFGASLFRNSFAGETTGGGAAEALAGLAAAKDAVPVDGDETIALGLIDDALLARVRAVATGEGLLTIEPVEGANSARIAVKAGVDTDMLLERLWKVGAKDAFVVRD